jgi:hypothetical protein
MMTVRFILNCMHTLFSIAYAGAKCLYTHHTRAHHTLPTAKLLQQVHYASTRLASSIESCHVCLLNNVVAYTIETPRRRAR